MKCIKYIGRETDVKKAGYITRVSEIDAQKAVNSENWEYATKEKWREQRNNPLYSAQNYPL